MIKRKILLECLLASAMLAMSGSVVAQPRPLMDFGDAPNSYGTKLDMDGARHADGSNIYLGSAAPDYEPDGQPALVYGDLADKDDNTPDPLVFPPEEDGVQYVGSFRDSAGTIAYGEPGTYYGGYWGKVIVTLHATNHATLTSNLFLDGWLDFGHDGQFGNESGTTYQGAQPGTAWSELIVSAEIDPTLWSTDEQEFTYTFMNGEGPNGPFYSRFRVNYGEGINNPTGPKLTGEVEDVGGLGHGQETPEPATSLLMLGALMALVSARWLRRT